MMFAQHREHAKCHWIAHFEWIKWWVLYYASFSSIRKKRPCISSYDITVHLACAQFLICTSFEHFHHYQHHYIKYMCPHVLVACVSVGQLPFKCQRDSISLILGLETPLHLYFHPGVGWVVGAQSMKTTATAQSFTVSKSSPLGYWHSRPLPSSSSWGAPGC